MPNFSFMAPPLYTSLKSDINDLIDWEETAHVAFCQLKEELLSPLTSGHRNFQLPFFLFTHERKGNALGSLLKNMEDNICPLAIVAHN